MLLETLSYYSCSAHRNTVLLRLTKGTITLCPAMESAKLFSKVFTQVCDPPAVYENSNHSAYLQIHDVVFHKVRYADGSSLVFYCYFKVNFLND